MIPGLHHPGCMPEPGSPPPPQGLGASPNPGAQQKREPHTPLAAGAREIQALPSPRPPKRKEASPSFQWMGSVGQERDRSAPAAGPPAAAGGEGGGPPAPPPNLTSNRRLQQTQAQVDEVVDIMRVNVDKVLERDQKLSELDDRADALQAGASQFETSAAKLKRKYWWKNLKMMIILGVICAIILIIIIVYFST
nr:vesicle-associated membrane protein 2 isoform X1 [Pelodiscus sinensis]|eukprot:XP_025037061.1 vesicle-associated membrane protein 2 isoform X1 [Pelodiscus sinensis]